MKVELNEHKKLWTYSFDCEGIISRLPSRNPSKDPNPVQTCNSASRRDDVGIFGVYREDALEILGFSVSEKIDFWNNIETKEDKGLALASQHYRT
jgi:hypothetical protein